MKMFFTIMTLSLTLFSQAFAEEYGNTHTEFNNAEYRAHVKCNGLLIGEDTNLTKERLEELKREYNRFNCTTVNQKSFEQFAAEYQIATDLIKDTLNKKRLERE